MSDEQDKLKASLEPPKLFGRKKKSDAMGPSKGKGTAPASESTVPADDAAVEELVEESPPEELEPEEPASEESAAPEPEAEAEADPVEPEPEPEPVEPEDETDPDPVAPEPEPEPVAEVTPDPEPDVEPVPVAKPAAKASGATPRTVAAKATDTVRKAVRPRAKLAPDIEPEPLTSFEQEDAEITAHANEPLLPLYPAAAVTGVAVGAAMVLLVWVSLRGCEAVRGTSSCTGGPGFLLLVATFVLCVLLGSALLKVFSISDPGSSSFLAVGLVAVMSLLFLIDVLGHWSMLIVIPIVGVGAFLASVWVTKTFVEPDST